MKVKVSRKKRVVITAIMAIVLVMVMTGCGGVDFIATVQQHRPMAAFGQNDTNNAVVNRFVASPRWSASSSGNTTYVEMNGTLRGWGDDFQIRWRVTAADGGRITDGSSIYITPSFISLGNENITRSNEALEFLLFMFEAFELGYEHLPW